MIINKLALFSLLSGSAAAFTPSLSKAFISRSNSVVVTDCAHHATCSCSACSGQSRVLLTKRFLTGDEVAESTADPTVEDIVEAMDGVENTDEAHNTERPARKTLRKKVGPRGKPLSEFNTGDTVKGKVKAITNYGAFLDVGAVTDGLLHISQLAVEFVSDVNEILTVGQEIDVRITSIDEKKGQLALTLLSADEEENAKEAASRPRQPRERSDRQSNRRDDSAVLKSLVEAGWDSDKFVEGTVISTLDFGAFVRLDVSQLAEGVEGEIDGLVHISALTAGRANSVSSVVSVDDKVQVRVKAIADRKVSLTMVSVEDEAAKLESTGASQPSQGAKDWKESMGKIQETMPEFNNRPLVVDLRK